MSYNYAPPSAVIAVSVLFPVIGSVAVASRFFTRSQGKSSISIDDWLVVPALIVEWIIAALLIWGAATNSLGVPLPTPNIPGPNAYLFANSDQQIRMSKIQYHVDWLGTIALGLLKASLLLLYRKIFCTTRSVFSILTTTMLVVVVAWTITFTLGLILRCGTDPQAVWGLHIYAAKLCPHSAKLREGYANSDFIIDVLIWFMPIPKVWSLHMTPRRKIAIVCVFLIGILAIAASAVRMTFNYTVLGAWVQSTNQGEIYVTDLMFWTIIEVGTGLIVICSLTLRSFFAKLSPRGILKEIRSAVSLRSLRSYASGDSVHGQTNGYHAGSEGTTKRHVSTESRSDAEEGFEMGPRVRADPQQHG